MTREEQQESSQEQQATLCFRGVMAPGMLNGSGFFKRLDRVRLTGPVDGGDELFRETTRRGILFHFEGLGQGNDTLTVTIGGRGGGKNIQGWWGSRLQVCVWWALEIWRRRSLHIRRSGLTVREKKKSIFPCHGQDPTDESPHAPCVLRVYVYVSVCLLARFTLMLL